MSNMENVIDSLVEHYLPNMSCDEYFVDIEFYLDHVVRSEYYDVALTNLEELLSKPDEQYSPLEWSLVTDSVYCIYEWLRLEKLEAHEQYREW